MALLELFANLHVEACDGEEREQDRDVDHVIHAYNVSFGRLGG